MGYSVIDAIRLHFSNLEQGTPVATAQLINYGGRSAVDQALVRLCGSNELKRATRGVYYRPAFSRVVGEVPVDAREVAAAIAAGRGEKLMMHGAEAARRFGLITQMSLSPVFLTNGPSRTTKVGKTVIRFQKANPSVMKWAGRPAGEALVALKYMGQAGATPEAVGKVRAALPEGEFEALAEAALRPGWLNAAIVNHSQSKSLQSGRPALV